MKAELEIRKLLAEHIDRITRCNNQIIELKEQIRLSEVALTSLEWCLQNTSEPVPAKSFEDLGDDNWEDTRGIF